MRSKKAIALVTVLISITILTIIAGISLMLATSQASLVENQIRRIKAFYTIEGLTWKYFCDLATGVRQDQTFQTNDFSLNNLNGVVDYSTANDAFKVSVNY